MIRFTALALIACSDPTASQSPPPSSLTMTISGPVESGSSPTVEVQGLRPRERVVVYVAEQRGTSCPVALRGLCLNLGGAVIAIDASADNAGVLRMTPSVPITVRRSTVRFFQAVGMRSGRMSGVDVTYGGTIETEVDLQWAGSIAAGEEADVRREWSTPRGELLCSLQQRVVLTDDQACPYCDYAFELEPISSSEILGDFGIGCEGLVGRLADANLHYGVFPYDQSHLAPISCGYYGGGSSTCVVDQPVLWQGDAVPPYHVAAYELLGHHHEVAAYTYE